MTVTEPTVLPAVLGWSNPSTAEESVRLYALDAGPSPRWAPEGGRTVERAIAEQAVGGALGEDFPAEGDCYLVVRVGRREVGPYLEDLAESVRQFIKWGQYPTRYITGLGEVARGLMEQAAAAGAPVVVPGHVELSTMPEAPGQGSTPRVDETVRDAVLEWAAPDEELGWVGLPALTRDLATELADFLWERGLTR